MTRAGEDQMSAHFAMEVRGFDQRPIGIWREIRVGIFFSLAMVFSRVSFRSPSLIGKHKGSPHYSRQRFWIRVFEVSGNPTQVGLKNGLCRNRSLFTPPPFRLTPLPTLSSSPSTNHDTTEIRTVDTRGRQVPH